MCWFHAKKAVKKNISRFVKDTIKRNVDKNRLTSYKFAAGEAKIVKDCNILTKWKTFQEFEERFCLGLETFVQDENQWINGSCSCPPFSRPTFVNIGLAIRLRFVKPPVEAKALPLTQKRKRGVANHPVHVNQDGSSIVLPDKSDV